MQKPGKDNSGEKIYLKNPDGSKRLDGHGHLVVDHDLFNHEGMTQDGIAEAFIEFAKKEKLAFFLSSESRFDAERYAALLERLEVSEVYFSELDLGDRYDAEFFTKQYLSIEKRLDASNSITLEEAGKFVASAFYPPAVHLYDSGDTPFIRCVDCIDFPTITQWQDALFEKLPRAFVDGQKGINTLKNKDIAITKVGTPSFASIVLSPSLVALSRTVLGLKNIKNINPFYLLVFLRSKYGFSQLQRHRELTIQYQLTLERVKKVRVFRPSDNFQKKIEIVLLKHVNFLEKAREKYTAAQDTLLAELGLNGYQPNTENTAICNFKDSFGKTGRLDAEYYQPRYAQMVKAIQGYSGGFDKLKNLVTLHTQTVTPVDDTEYQYVELSHIGNYGEITGCLVDVGRNLPTRARYQVATDQVLLPSIEGSLSSIAIVPQVYNHAFCSTGFYPLSSSSINSETLLLFFKSPAGQMQLQRGCNGTILTAINNYELSNIHIPKIQPVVQSQLQKQVQQSFSLRQQSHTLLEHAKHAVELAIEHDETRALAFLSHSA